MSYVVNYGQHRISYSVEFRDRTTMEIAVLPDGTVRVKAPLGAEDSRIREKIHRRAGWIVKQQRYFEQFAIRTPKRQYLGGETHLYLGRQYRLKLVVHPKVEVKISRGFIQIFSPDISPGAIQKILDRYYRKRAKEKYPEYLCRSYWFGDTSSYANSSDENQLGQHVANRNPIAESGVDKSTGSVFGIRNNP